MSSMMMYKVISQLANLWNRKQHKTLWKAAVIVIVMRCVNPRENPFNVAVMV